MQKIELLQQNGFYENAYDIFSKYSGVIYGEPTLLVEASSRGFKPFSPFFAYVDGLSIERLYQRKKKINGTYVADMNFSNYREEMDYAKGKPAENIEECRALYRNLWNTYIDRNPDLQDILCRVTAVGDCFGKSGQTCQATELWRIRSELLGIEATPEYKKVKKEQPQMSLF